MTRTVARSACIILLLWGVAIAQDSKAPVPDKAKLEALNKQLKDLFKTEYSKRDGDSRKEFAKKLLSDAAGTSDLNQRFVMISGARDLAAEAGDVDLAFGAIAQITEQYDVRTAGPDWSPTAQKVAALAKARKVAKSREAATAIAEAYLTVAREGPLRPVGDFLPLAGGPSGREGDFPCSSSRIK